MKLLRKMGLAVFLLVPLIGLIDAGLEIRRVSRVPSMSEWQATAKIVRQSYKKGDIIHFEPYWADQGWKFFEHMDIDVVQYLDTNELSTYKRVWIVASMSGLPFDVPKGFKPLMKKKDGRVTTYLLQPERGQKNVFDLLSGLKTARVSRIYAKRTEECRNFRDNHWYCGPVHPWQFVGELVRDVAGTPRRVIWAHPLNYGNRLVIEYPKVPAGSQLEVDYGWSQRAIESDQGAPVQFEVYADGKPAVSVLLKKENHKWNRLLIRLDPKLKSHKLKLVIRTKNYQTRQFCFKGWVFK